MPLEMFEKCADIYNLKRWNRLTAGKLTNQHKHALVLLVAMGKHSTSVDLCILLGSPVLNVYTFVINIFACSWRFAAVNPSRRTPFHPSVHLVSGPFWTSNSGLLTENVRVIDDSPSVHPWLPTLVTWPTVKKSYASWLDQAVSASSGTSIALSNSYSPLRDWFSRISCGTFIRLQVCGSKGSPTSLVILFLVHYHYVCCSQEQRFPGPPPSLRFRMLSFLSVVAS